MDQLVNEGTIAMVKLADQFKNTVSTVAQFQIASSIRQEVQKRILNFLIRVDGSL